MRKINLVILFMIALLLIFTCSEPSENHSFSSKGPSNTTTTNFVEFTTVGTHYWSMPDNVVGDLSVTLVGGGGAGGASVTDGDDYGGGGGGAGDVIIYQVPVVDSIKLTQIIVGDGGKGTSGSGTSGQNSIFRYTGIEFTVSPGSGGGKGSSSSGGAGGSGHPTGSSGSKSYGGNGGNNGRGYGSGGNGTAGGSAPANSGGGGGGAEDSTGYGGNGGSGYVRIEYTVSE